MTGLEEILFENRNKNYGAYLLRKKANKYLMAGLLLSLGIIFLTSITLFVVLNSDLFFPETYSENINIESFQLSDLQDFKFPEPPKAQEKAVTDFEKPEIVDTVLEAKKKVEATKVPTASADTLNKKGADTDVDGKGANLGGDSLAVKVDKMPLYIGGTPELIKFLRRNLAETSRKCKARQKVVVQFTVYKTGYVKDAAIVFGINPDIDKEVLKVISMFPKWEPALQNGHPVSFRFNLPINL